jgi:hypothetical protein
MRQVFRRLAFATLAGIMTVSCGGGGGGEVASGGIGGTGISSGTITGFGSIFVNGFELDLSEASVTVDEQSGCDPKEFCSNPLKLGMVVTALVEYNADGSIARTLSVEADDDVEGPIADVPVLNPNGTKTFTVLSTAIIVDPDDTVIDDNNGLTFDNITQGDVVQVYGFFNNEDALIAKHIGKKTGPGGEVEVKGKIKNLSFTGTNPPEGTLDIRSLTISFNGATDLSDVPGGLAEGLFVEVKGILTGPDTVSATKIELEDLDGDIDQVSIEGIIASVDQNNSRLFVLNGPHGPISVDATTATFEPATLNPVPGLEVEVEGSFKNNTLKAAKVEARGGNIKIEAMVSAVNESTMTMTMTMTFWSGAPIDVMVNSQTRLEDKTGTDPVPPFELSDISSGSSFLKIKGFDDGNGNIVAIRVKRDDPNDEVLQGPVEGVGSQTFGDNTSGQVTILGIKFPTDAGTEFEEGTIDGDEFFNNIVVEGDIVKVKDKILLDGIADTVKFEND